MTNRSTSMAALEFQDVTHQLVQQFIVELDDMLDDLTARELAAGQKNVLNKIVSFFDIEMKKHHLEEERRIFPMLLSRGDETLTGKVSTLQAEHEQLRSGWDRLKQAIEHMVARPGSDATELLLSFEHYSQCFAGHLVLEESIQFSPETSQLFGAWDASVDAL